MVGNSVDSPSIYLCMAAAMAVDGRLLITTNQLDAYWSGHYLVSLVCAKQVNFRR
ncbi:hypothetical protein Tsubulata_027008 [Turnera subulata]|uniref:Uncharacterized protein n=1 Tax=Turnera subulata TaxID=218843 RepID=A0A9Q0GGT3_9ROSI|nr:hypothetical protein Tsubulata_027008 [Turnera subulata]